jgi:hypothetical protein
MGNQVKQVIGFLLDMHYSVGALLAEDEDLYFYHTFLAFKHYFLYVYIRLRCRLIIYLMKLVMY